MSAAALLALGAVGLVVGFVSGLVGIGGGVLIVPFLYFFYAHPEFAGSSIPLALQTTVAHATSLFIIVPTAVVGTITYTRHRAVMWRAAVPVALFSSVAAVLASRIAPQLDPHLLKLAFAAFLLFTAFDMGFGKRPPVQGELRVSLPLAALTGVLVGTFSALLGVGGGIVAIPLLMRLLHVRLEHVAATSLAIVGVAALSGAVSYMLAGGEVAGLPAGHVGYVHLAAALPILVGAAIAVRWGARTNQRMDARKLKLLFAALFAVLGVKLMVENLPHLLH